MRIVSDVGATSYWAVIYDEPPLNLLERVDGSETEAWINGRLPFVGTGVDWGRVVGSHRHWFAESDDELSSVVVEFLSVVRDRGDVTHVGDALSPFAVRITSDELGDALPALLEIPEHHYLVSDDRTWCGVFRTEGDVDLALFEVSR
jgi:hypothetical protein